MYSSKLGPFSEYLGLHPVKNQGEAEPRNIFPALGKAKPFRTALGRRPRKTSEEYELRTAGLRDDKVEREHTLKFKL